MTRRADKTLIHRLVSFKAALKLIWTLNRLVPIEVHYMEKNPGTIIKNLNFFLTEERMTWTSWMTWG